MIRGSTSVYDPLYSYPKSRYEPSPVIDLSSPNERRRLSASAIKAFLAITRRWNLRGQEARGLAGDLTLDEWRAWGRHPEPVLEQSSLIRVSHIVSIFHALHEIHGEELADIWIRLPNTNHVFRGECPLTVMLMGGTPVIQRVRSLLDARRFGK